MYNMADLEFARKSVCILVLIVLCGYPALACLNSAGEMTAVERECCEKMAQECGSMNMPGSHSCCQTEMRRSNPMLVIAIVYFVPLAPSTASVNDLFVLPISKADFSVFEVHPPPESPPGSPSILRI